MRERSPGVWELRVYAGRDPVTGKPRQISRTFRGAKRAANAALNDLVTANAENAVGTSATFGRLLDDWLEQSARAGRAATTLDTYGRWVEKRIKPALGDVRLPNLTTHRIDVFLSSLDEQLAASTIAVIRSIMGAACEQGVRWGWIQRNPVAGTLERRIPDKERVALPAEAVRRLVERCIQDDRVLGCAVAFAALTGARRGEVLGLQWSDVDLEARIAVIRRNVTPATGGVHIGPPKNNKNRTIAIPQAAGLILALRAHWADLLGHEPPATNYIFGADDGARPWRPQSLSEFFAANAKREGIKAHFHELRHYVVSQAIGAGWDVTTASAYFGHTPQVMLSVYSHGDPERQAQLAAGLK